jgi:hypothetical protein
VVATLAGTAGCAALGRGRPAHTVSVYLADREATRDVRVTVRDASDEPVFDRRYALSDANEAHEDATFPAATEPERVVVTVDGTRFERPWPSPVDDDCASPIQAGVEVYVRGGPDEAPSIRLDRNCQSVTVSDG